MQWQSRTCAAQGVWINSGVTTNQIDLALEHTKQSVSKVHVRSAPVTFCYSVTTTLHKAVESGAALRNTARCNFSFHSFTLFKQGGNSEACLNKTQSLTGVCSLMEACAKIILVNPLDVR